MIYRLLRSARNDVIFNNLASLRGVLNLIGEAIQKKIKTILD